MTLLTILLRVPETQPPGPGPSAKWNPRILSTPLTEAEKGKLYSYTPTANETVVWQLATNATWLSLSQGKVQGTPDKERMWYTVSIKAINQVEGAAWQNYTIRVKAAVTPPVVPPPEELPPGGPAGLYTAIGNIESHLENITLGNMPEAARKGQENALDHLKANLQRWIDKHGSSSSDLRALSAELQNRWLIPAA